MSILSRFGNWIVEHTTNQKIKEIEKQIDTTRRNPATIINLPTVSDILKFQDAYNSETDNRQEFLLLQLKRLSELATRYQDRITSLANQNGLSVSSAIAAGAGVAGVLVSGPFIPVVAVISLIAANSAKKEAAYKSEITQIWITYVQEQLTKLSTLYQTYENELKQSQNPLNKIPLWAWLLLALAMAYFLKRKKATE